MATANRSKPGDDGQVLIPAVGYVRMSSDKQEASPAQQRAEITKYAERSGYAVLRWYEDDGISGWKDTREAFQQLIEDAERRADFRAVLCWDQNRFSRFPPMEANHYWYLLDCAGVHLATVNQGRIDWHSIAGWLTASIRQHADAEHRHKLSADVKRGKRAVAEQGLWQSKPPFGYIVVDRRLQLGDPLHVELVRRIFLEYTEGRSIRSIAAKLNAEGYASLTDDGWTVTTVRGKLANVTYTGLYRWNDIEIPNNHPAIIDAETWGRVQVLLGERKRRTTPHTDGGGFLFTSLLRCGKCASAMTGFSECGSEFYRCHGNNEKGTCDRNSVKQRELLGYVIDTIEAHWMDPATVKAIRDELHSIVAAEHPKVDGKQIERQLASLDAKLTKAKRRLVEVDVDMLPAVQEQIRELRSQHDQLQTALKAASTPRNALFADADERIDRAVSAFCGLRGVLESADTVHQREVVRETVHRIDVWAERKDRRNRFRLDRGLITLRAENLFGLPSLSEQLIALPFTARKAG